MTHGTMQPDEWAQVKSLFEAVSAVPAADREQFLHAATSDPTLIREVQLLLAADAESGQGMPPAEGRRRAPV